MKRELEHLKADKDVPCLWCAKYGFHAGDVGSLHGLLPLESKQPGMRLDHSMQMSSTLALLRHDAKLALQ